MESWTNCWATAKQHKVTEIIIEIRISSSYRPTVPLREVITNSAANLLKIPPERAATIPETPAVRPEIMEPTQIGDKISIKLWRR